jgi:hypothetical protein
LANTKNQKKKFTDKVDNASRKVQEAGQRVQQVGKKVQQGVQRGKDAANKVVRPITKTAELAGRVGEVAGNVVGVVMPRTGRAISAVGQAVQLPEAARRLILGNHPEWWGGSSNVITATSAPLIPYGDASNNTFDSGNAIIFDRLPILTDDPFVASHIQSVIVAYYNSLGLDYNSTVHITVAQVLSSIETIASTMARLFMFYRAQQARNARDGKNRNIANFLIGYSTSVNGWTQAATQTATNTTITPYGEENVSNAAWNELVATILKDVYLPETMWQYLKYQYGYHHQTSTASGNDSYVTFYLASTATSNTHALITRSAMETARNTLAALFTTYPLLAGVLQSMGFSNRLSHYEEFNRDPAGNSPQISVSSDVTEALANMFPHYRVGSSVNSDLIRGDVDPELNGIPLESMVKLNDNTTDLFNLDLVKNITIGDLFSKIKYRYTRPFHRQTILLRANGTYIAYVGYPLMFTPEGWNGSASIAFSIGIPEAIMNTMRANAYTLGEAILNPIFPFISCRATGFPHFDEIDAPNTGVLRSADLYVVRDVGMYSRVARTNWLLGTNYMSQIRASIEKLNARTPRLV